MPLEIPSGPLRLGGKGGLRIKSGSTAFTPTSIAGLQRWFKADAGTSTTTDGVGLATWTDQSAGATNATQATGSLQPLYKTNILNSKPGIKFDGVDDFLASGSISTVTSTMVIVASGTVAATRELIHSGHEFYYENSTTWWVQYQGSQHSGAVVAFPTSAHVFASRLTGAATSDIRIDGTISGTAGNAATGNMNAASISIGRHSGLGRFWDGYMHEILIWNVVLTTPQLVSVEAYLKSKWATP